MLFSLLVAVPVRKFVPPPLYVLSMMGKPADLAVIFAGVILLSLMLEPLHLCPNRHHIQII
jgi:hypothetical protein